MEIKKYVAKRDLKWDVFGIVFLSVSMFVMLVLGSPTLSFVVVFGTLYLVIGLICLLTIIKHNPVAIIEQEHLEVYSRLGKNGLQFRWEDIVRFDRCRVRSGRHKGDDFYIVLKERSTSSFKTEEKCIDLDQMIDKNTFLEKITQTGIPIRDIGRLEYLRENFTEVEVSTRS